MGLEAIEADATAAGSGAADAPPHAASDASASVEMADRGRRTMLGAIVRRYRAVRSSMRSMPFVGMSFCSVSVVSRIDATRNPRRS